MIPHYSILLCNQQISEYENRISDWLSDGVKVLWFGTSAEADLLKNRHAGFAKAFLLQAYETRIRQSGMIVDGADVQGLLDHVTADCPLFNAAQYRVEHCRADAHIVVQASAGTGKTTVMIDRILYLLHTQPELSLSEIFMITFTNEAAQQMSGRLQDVFMTRYRLTKKKQYLRWVEEQSQMHISTIHSFAYFMLKKYGIGEGFTKSLQIGSLDFERTELIRDAVDRQIHDRKSVLSQLGVPYFRANTIVDDFWGKFSQLGVSHTDLNEMDWGDPVDVRSASFHRKLQDMIGKLDEAYFDVKRQKEVIAVNDIMRDLEAVLTGAVLPEAELSMKYLFVDEFQDSDLSQIRAACILGKLLGTALFVVGDVKQSIYRFRGATDQAFDLFELYRREYGLDAPVFFTLINNYRTSADVLERMDEYFDVWGRNDVLAYDQAVIPFNQDPGICMMIPSEEKETPARQLVRIVNRELDLLIRAVEAGGKEPTEKNRVAVLTRSNKELSDLAVLFREAKIPASVQQDGCFYRSAAVRDFYTMIASFFFCDEPKYIFQYLLTPYAGETEPMDLNLMERLNGDYDDLVAYLNHFLEQTSWKEYHRQLRLRPVLAVLRDMLEQEKVTEHYVSQLKAKRSAEGWMKKRLDAEVYLRAAQYQANLEKLMEILQNNLGGDKVSLYQVYQFLKLNIASNRTEPEAEVQSKDDYTSVLCMTVHKSKGLEFDTVIIPYTDQNFGGRAATELLIDPVRKRVGWNYTGDGENRKRRSKYMPMQNSYYEYLKAEDIESGEREGVRVLYVGMTRAVSKLFCIVEESRNSMSWAKLIEEVGVDYE